MEDYSSISTLDSVETVAAAPVVKTPFYKNQIVTHAGTGLISGLILGGVGYFLGRKKGIKDTCTALNEDLEETLKCIKEDRKLQRDIRNSKPIKKAVEKQAQESEVE